MKKQVFHVKDPKTDDFATTIEEKDIKPLPKNYKFIHDTWYEKALAFLIYQVIAKPFGALSMKLGDHYKIINKKAIKKAETGAFLYINHTMRIGDAFLPSLLGQRKNYIIVGDQAASITWLLPVMRMVGSLPLSENMRQFIQLRKAVEERLQKKGNTVTIYPEQHVWPYYTGIREFSNTSFKYPAIMNKPMFVVTNCYQKRNFGNKPKLVTVIDGPYYPDPSLSSTENSIKLRDIAFEMMVQRTKEYSTYAIHDYVFDEVKEKEN